jgi:hypothetical protein
MRFDRIGRAAAATAILALAGCSSGGGTGYVSPSGQKASQQAAAPRTKR